MNTNVLLASLLASTSAFAANFGTPPSGAPAAPVAGVAPAAVAAIAAGPQAGTLFRIVKPDGATVIQQGNMSLPGAPMELINLSENDAFIKSNGKCAFNVKYDEVSASAAAGTVNRLFSNDGVIAINSNISLLPGVVKTVWTQPYLFAGMNNVRVVINADGAAPSTKWIKVNVAGNCGKVPTTTPPVVTTTPPTTTPPVVTAPPVTPPAPPVVYFKPGSSEWQNLNVVWGYSNYATTQLKDKGYSRYSELARLNASVTGIINAKVVTQAGYNSLMTTWNTFVTEAAFRTAMSTVVAQKTGVK